MKQQRQSTPQQHCRGCCRVLQKFSDDIISLNKLIYTSPVSSVVIWVESNHSWVIELFNK